MELSNLRVREGAGLRPLSVGPSGSSPRSSTPIARCRHCGQAYSYEKILEHERICSHRSSKKYVVLNLRIAEAQLLKELLHWLASYPAYEGHAHIRSMLEKLANQLGR